MQEVKSGSSVTIGKFQSILGFAEDQALVFGHGSLELDLGHFPAGWSLVYAPLNLMKHICI